MQENPYRLVNSRHGEFLVNIHDTYIGRAIQTYGEFSESEFVLIDQLMSALNKDVIEVGANIGAHTVSMAKKLSTINRRLLAIEPQPVVFQNLCANVALNGLFNVVTENVAIGNSPGWLSFQRPNYCKEGNFGGVSMLEDTSGNQKVRVERLDAVVPDDFQVGLLKIDVEGFEKKVLEGATDTISRHRPIIYLENDRVEKSKELIEYLWQLGYRMWWHFPPFFNSNNFLGVSENIFGRIGSFNMVALPKELPMIPDNADQAEIKDSDFHPIKNRAQN